MNVSLREAHHYCRRVTFGARQWIRHVVIPFLFVFYVVRAVVHELFHGLMNLVLGGTAGFGIARTNILEVFGITFNSCFRGYCFMGLYGPVPVLSISWAETGSLLPAPWNRALALLAGPWSIILLFWAYAHYNNPVDLPCGRNVRWKWKRGWAWGLMVIAWFDVIYLVTDPFPGGFDGDGVNLIQLFQENGLVFYGLNLEYIIGFVAAVGTAYFTLLTLGMNPRNNLHEIKEAFTP